MTKRKALQEAIAKMEQTRQELSKRAARMKTSLLLGLGGENLPDIQCDCGLYMYWVTYTEPRCPIHGAIYQPIQRKLIDPLLEEDV